MWTFVLIDLHGTPLGELRQVTDRRLRFPLNRVPTFTFRMRATHPLAPYVVLDDKTLVKAYEDSTGRNVLRFLGPITTHDKTRDANGGSIVAGASGVGWRLSKRRVGKSTAGATFGTTPLATLDRGELAARTIEFLNAGEASNVFTDAGDTGIRRGSIIASAPTYVGPWFYKPADEVISELSAPLDGFDWEIAPVEPTPYALGLQLGALNCQPFIGSVNLEAGWEFGTGKRNVGAFREIGDSTALCNRGINLPPGYPDTSTQDVVQIDDVGSIADRGLYEDVIAGDLAVDQLRTKLVQEHVRIRRVPRRVITFDPIPEDLPAGGLPRRVPQLFVDYIVGDVMPFRALETFDELARDGTIIGQRSAKTVDALFRAHAADIEIDDVGGITKTSLTLLEDD